MHSPDSLDAYEEKKQRLTTSLRHHENSEIRLVKDTSNLFRQRKSITGPGLNVRDFNRVIRVEPRTTSYNVCYTKLLRPGLLACSRA